MIEYKNGDLFSVKTGILMHGCNAKGVMGSGVAKTFKELYPKAFDKYVSDLTFRNVILGENSYYLGLDNLVLVSAITQESYGTSKRQVSYDAIATCFQAVISVTGNLETINIPKIGGGLGGGNWNIIEKIINEIVKDRHIVCWIQ